MTAAFDPEGLFHLVPAALWRAHLASGTVEWSPPSLQREGFCHLSFGHQLEGTLAAHFAQAHELTVLELEPKALGPALRLERSRGEERFPHLYRPLLPTDIRGAQLLHRDAEGAWDRSP